MDAAAAERRQQTIKEVTEVHDVQITGDIGAKTLGVHTDCRVDICSFFCNTDLSCDFSTAVFDLYVLFVVVAIADLWDASCVYGYFI